MYERYNDRFIEKTKSPERIINEVITTVDAIGVPTTNVSEVVVHYQPYSSDERRLGSYHYLTGEIDLYGPVTNPEYFKYQADPEQAQKFALAATYAHECIGHSTCPTKKEHINIYGTKEAQDKAYLHAVAVARQSLTTGKFINGYHADLAKKLDSGDIDGLRFLRETHAIALETRLTDPDKLREVGHAQYAQLQEQGLEEEYVDIMEGVDKTLTSIIPNIDNTQQLTEHIASWRERFGYAVKDWEHLQDQKESVSALPQLQQAA